MVSRFPEITSLGVALIVMLISYSALNRKSVKLDSISGSVGFGFRREGRSCCRDRRELVVNQVEVDVKFNVGRM
jgi:hypothetical protein